MRLALSIWLLFALALPAPRARAEDFAMALSAQAQATHGIKNRQPIDQAYEFFSSEYVWIWTMVRGGNPGTVVRHVWKRDGVTVFRRELRVGARRWSTNSHHRCPPGAWTVQVQAIDASVLAEVEFIVK
ncbi:MAG: DUF2914 domain-containing protein [Deltaproteobacteria bacterium]|nr:DUF2914 domain-containing protein [Deltaproteobacteria bacterium]